MGKIHWAHQDMRAACGRIVWSYSNFRRKVTCLACRNAMEKGKRPNKPIPHKK